MATPFPDIALRVEADQLVAESEAAFQQEVRSIHGISLSVSADSENLFRLCSKLLAPFPVTSAPAKGGLNLCVTSRSTWGFPESVERLPPSNHEPIDTLREYGLETRYGRMGTTTYYELSPLCGVAIDLKDGVALGYVREFEAHDEWLIEHLFLQVALLELLRSRDLFWVHAGGVVSDDGRAVMITGHTGAGKTTTTAALACDGFRFLGDDRLFIQPSPGGVKILSYPRELAVLPDTFDLLPKLRAPVKLSNGKHRVDPKTCFPSGLAEQAEPGLLLFTQVGASSEPTLLPLSRAKALERLLPHSLLASNPAVTERHFEALSRLVACSTCYDVSLGRRCSKLTEQVRLLLEI